MMTQHLIQYNHVGLCQSFITIPVSWVNVNGQPECWFINYGGILLSQWPQDQCIILPIMCTGYLFQNYNSMFRVNWAKQSQESGMVCKIFGSNTALMMTTIFYIKISVRNSLLRYWHNNQCVQQYMDRGFKYQIMLSLMTNGYICIMDKVIGSLLTTTW